MMKDKIEMPTTMSWKWLLAMVMFLALSRCLPHPPNFTPLAAMSLLSGAFLRDWRLALIIPLSAMLLSDLYLGLHSSMLFVYLAMAGIVIFSRYALQRVSLIRLTSASVLSAVWFFLVTNFGAWLASETYAATLNGLMQAYVAGIPFFRNTLVSSVMFTLLAYLMLSTAVRWDYARTEAVK
ncbi:MAG: hypothetical protein P8O97_02245 [Gammaproteobacteria bacterium]|jgi:hypothetical protein|nr:hypothetical protein [Gammaproteobacteria bacterium]